jgi:hypothetical protein
MSKGLMKKLAIVTALIVIVAAFGILLAAAYLRHSNGEAVVRAQMLGAEIQQLRVGVSDYSAAQSIAKKFGTVPYENDYGGARDCNSGYFDGCAYMIPLNLSPMHQLALKHPFLSGLTPIGWSGSAFIYIAKGKVQEYSFGIIYRGPNKQWRGFGAEEGNTLPEYRAVQARISDSYSIERNDVRLGERPADLGFALESSLTPRATAVERQRAWHLQFSCLSQQHGCGEICDVMPEAWRDFYASRGHIDVEKYGPAYLFCTKTAMK